MTARLSPEREAEIAAAVAVYEGHPSIGFACCSAHGPADGTRELLAELAAVRAERDRASAAAFTSAADLVARYGAGSVEQGLCRDIATQLRRRAQEAS
ncbi:hypothetical protein [Streptomyces sp. STCH 565 A]|uniref:hypothetical protein n=1 Tax=Streptomyces sp. STCH 565 A TaxID=2950532 RepID=UPI002075CBE8|nr:hypothetical protein [Streptomyces sp. STCH 565 A]MCM8555675.1 hypothetical protein [Streptomyces sp. STCH 565 A]